MAGVIFVSSKFSKLNTEELSKDDLVINEEAEEQGKGYTNFVLFGGDSRTGKLGKGVRTDSIIIVSLNNETNEVKLVSVFRDTLLDLSKGKTNKANAAYSAGGAQQAINMLNMNLDLNIQKFVTVDFSSVSEVIDLLGGIEIELTSKEVKAVNQYIDETARVAGKKAKKLTKPGLQTLDGVQATTYARIRKGVGDDYQRTMRQRLVIEKALEKAIKSDLGTINKIIDKVFPTIYTNLKMSDVLLYAKSLTKYKISETQGFPSSKTSMTIPGKGSCIIPVTLKKNVQDLHAFLYGTKDYEPSDKVERISLKIQNETGNKKADANVPYQDNSSTTEELDDSKAQHNHKYDVEWRIDSKQHWHECSCGAKKDKATHEFEKVDDEENLKICIECGYEATTSSDSDESTTDGTGESSGANECTHKLNTKEWKTSKSQHWHECACGQKKSDAEEHTLSDEATATKPQTCTECGYVVKEAEEDKPHEHNYKEKSDKDHHWYECSCGDKNDIEEHTPEINTEDGAVVCEKCGWVITPAQSSTNPPGEES